MTYYRLALQNRRTDRWNWKSTALTSLASVFHLLRIYSAIPQDRLRVFSAPSKAELEEQLNAENNGGASSSVSAARFLHRNPEEHHQTGQKEQYAQPKEQIAPRSIVVVSAGLRQEQNLTAYAAGARAISTLDQKRLEIEMGAGGDHDTPYIFSLPTFMPQLLAWIQLQTRVHKQEQPA